MRPSWTVESGARWLDDGMPAETIPPPEPGVGYDEEGGGIRSMERGGGGGGCALSSIAYMA